MEDSNKFKIKIKLTEDDVKPGRAYIELSKKKVKDHIFTHWRDVVIKRAIIDDVIVVMEDLDTNSMHEVSFRYYKNNNRDSCNIQGLWHQNFIERRGLKAGDEIGIYCDPVPTDVLQDLRRRICTEQRLVRASYGASAKFCFSVLK